MKKVRWGILGAGGIADRRTLPGMQLAEHAEIVSVMEIDPAFAERLREKYHAKRAYSDDAALLSDPEIDAGGGQRQAHPHRKTPRHDCRGRRSRRVALPGKGR